LSQLPDTDLERASLVNESVTAAMKEVPTHESSVIEHAVIEGVRNVWQELLQSNVRDTDNFFDVGGHSLLFLPLLSKLKMLPEQRPISDASTKALKAITTLDLINYPSIERFCQFICKPEHAGDPQNNDKVKNQQDARARMLKLRNRQAKRA
jgi:hypothetical protein